MPLRIALVRFRGSGNVCTMIAEEGTQKEFEAQWSDKDSTVLEFITVEGRLADALHSLCGIGEADGDDTLRDQLEALLDQVVAMPKHNP